MPVELTYWEQEDAVTYDIENDAPLTTAEAQVIATTQLAREVAEIGKTLKEILELAYKELDSRGARA